MKEPDSRNPIVKATRKTGPMSAEELEDLKKAMLHNLSDPKLREQVDIAEVERDETTMREAGKRLSRLIRANDEQERAALWLEEGRRFLHFATSADYQSEYRIWLKHALECFDKATALDRDYAAAWFEKVIVLDLLEFHADALSASEEVIRLLPEDAEAWFHKGIALANLGRYGEAETAFANVLRLRPSDRQALYEKAMALRNQNRPEQELSAWRDVLDAGPPGPSDQSCPHRWWGFRAFEARLNARFFFANDLSRLGHREEALDEYRRAIREGAQHLQGPLALSGFTEALRLSEQAREAYLEFHSEDEDKVVAWYRKGKVFLRAGCSGDAIMAFETVIDLDPNNADAWLWKGEALLQAGRPRDALAAFEKSLPLNPKAYMLLEERLKMLREKEGLTQLQSSRAF